MKVIKRQKNKVIIKRKTGEMNIEFNKKNEEDDDDDNNNNNNKKNNNKNDSNDDDDDNVISINYYKNNTFTWTVAVNYALCNIFKLSSFRENQKAIVNGALSDCDELILMCTGGGKSLCYQLPAVLKKGCTIVISPLLALIQDQVSALKNLNISAFSLTSATPPQEQADIIKTLTYFKNNGSNDIHFKILYVTPERLITDKFIHTLKQAVNNNMIQRFVVDEAHSISCWGHCFRPDYTSIGKIKQLFPRIPFMALTATASEKVKKDIIKQIGLNEANVLIFQSTFNRPNINYQVKKRNNMQSVSQIFQWIISNNMIEKTGIIYCSYKADCENVAKTLNELYENYLKSFRRLVDKQKSPIKNRIFGNNHNNRLNSILIPRTETSFASVYHSETPNKDIVQNGWMQNHIKVVCCTIAFGMGINKEDVRYVIHYSLPKSIENYYQESGRAGRDGKQAHSVVFYGESDYGRLYHLITDQSNNNINREKKNYDKVSEETVKNIVSNLHLIKKYCEQTTECRRVFLLRYFGEKCCSTICDKTCDVCMN